jgi:arylsulfatase A-like enzyme
VIHSWADGRIEDTGPLTKKRMETIDDEIIEPAQRFIRDAVDGDAVLHVVQHHRDALPDPHAPRRSGARPDHWQSEYHDAMVEHDKRIGAMLDQLDELGIADDTIVLYSTDNGVHMNTWPDGDDAVPQREELVLGRCVPGAVAVRWPGQHRARGRCSTGSSRTPTGSRRCWPLQVSPTSFLKTFRDFPPRQKPGSFSLDRVLEELQEGQPK